MAGFPANRYFDTHKRIASQSNADSPITNKVT